jgi:hypothetical protein
MSTSTEHEPLVCGTCGAVPDSEERARLTWSRGIEAGRAQWACERCSREFVRSIESKLDPVWW